MQQDLTGVENRLVQVVRNAFWAATKADNQWPLGRRLEAGAALIRYFLAGRATFVLGISLGGLLALHASFMLADQNRKLDLQNHLSVVASEIAEAQRNSQFAQLIAPLMEDVRRVTQKNGAQAQYATLGGRTVTSLDLDTALRVAVLTQSFQPYRWVERTEDAKALLAPVGEGPLFHSMRAVRRVYDNAFGLSAMDLNAHGSTTLQLPVLTPARYSPERGLILTNLYAARVDFRGLSTRNVTFERAYLPGARLDGLDFGEMVGPDLSKPTSLAGAYMPRSTMNRAGLGGVDLTGAYLVGAEFGGVRARQARWDRANLEEVTFAGADLAASTFSSTNMKGAVLNAANLSGANLRSALNLTNQQLATACLHSRTTQLPASSTLANYKLSTDCCRLWEGSVNGFQFDDAGNCIAK